MAIENKEFINDLWENNDVSNRSNFWENIEKEVPTNRKFNWIPILYLFRIGNKNERKCLKTIKNDGKFLKQIAKKGHPI